jgi:hypothetical protein
MLFKVEYLRDCTRRLSYNGAAEPFAQRCIVELGNRMSAEIA